MSNRKFIAVWDEELNDYRWYSVVEAQRNYHENEGKPPPEGCTETVFKATGKFINRDDGEQAEIFE